MEIVVTKFSILYVVEAKWAVKITFSFNAKKKKINNLDHKIPLKYCSEWWIIFQKINFIVDSGNRS